MGASSGDISPLRALIDTNVALDLFLKREPWVSEAQELLDAFELGRIVGYVPASALTDVFYISRRIVGIEKAFAVLDLCLDAFDLVPVDRVVIDLARGLAGSDFEDNVQIACAQIAQLDAIVTRDAAGFARASIPVLAPKEAAARLK